MMRDRAEMEADLGTFPPQGSLCLSGVSNWLPKRRGPAGSLGEECFAPVLLLRILILRRFDTTTSATGNRFKRYMLNDRASNRNTETEMLKTSMSGGIYLRHRWRGQSGASCPGCGCCSSPEGWYSSQTGRSWRRS